MVDLLRCVCVGGWGGGWRWSDEVANIAFGEIMDLVRGRGGVYVVIALYEPAFHCGHVY